MCVQHRLSLLSDLCRDEFDFAWRRPMARLPDSEQVRDILQQTSSVIAAIDIHSYSQAALSAAVGSVIQTSAYSYGQCMKVLRKAVSGPKVRTTYMYTPHTCMYSLYCVHTLLITKLVIYLYCLLNKFFSIP